MPETLLVGTGRVAALAGRASWGLGGWEGLWMLMLGLELEVRDDAGYLRVSSCRCADRW